MDDELKTVLGLVVGKLDQVLSTQREHSQQIATLQADVSVLKVGQAQILEHLDVAELKGRVEEQSRTIASLIPTRVAAVPGR